MRIRDWSSDVGSSDLLAGWPGREPKKLRKAPEKRFQKYDRSSASEVSEEGRFKASKLQVLASLIAGEISKIQNCAYCDRRKHRSRENNAHRLACQALHVRSRI